MAKITNELRECQIIPRKLIFDNSLSDRARFVYCFMAAKPDDWEFFLEPMAKEIGYGVETLRKYINELVGCGWLVKGAQSNENGKFGAVEYIIKANNETIPCPTFTDTVKYRHGKNTTRYNNIDNIQNRDCKDKNEIDKSISQKDELFEKCWLAYNRKGSKKKAKEQWAKLSEEEKDKVLPHIHAYTSSRERQYQKDFERYIRDRTFCDTVTKGNSIIYDPSTKHKNIYAPVTDGSILWSEKYNSYIYMNMFFGYIPDGYNDNERPNGATIMLNNGCDYITWNNKTKEWENKK